LDPKTSKQKVETWSAPGSPAGDHFARFFTIVVGLVLTVMLTGSFVFNLNAVSGGTFVDRYPSSGSILIVSDATTTPESSTAQNGGHSDNAPDLTYEASEESLTASPEQPGPSPTTTVDTPVSSTDGNASPTAAAHPQEESPTPTTGQEGYVTPTAVDGTENVAIPTPSPPMPSPSPNTRTIDWGVWEPGVPWDMTLLDTFEASVDKRVTVIQWGQPWMNNGKFEPFYAGNAEAVRQRGAIPLIDWASWDLRNTTHENPDFQLIDIIEGRYDDHIRNWAIGARTWGHPILVRFNWEMNGIWFPWSEIRNGNQTGEYITAWRHVVDIFREEGAWNVQWVWCVNTAYPGSIPIASLYPGHDYVDWLAMDGYNWGGDSWLEPEYVFDETYAELVKLAPEKPIIISEVGVHSSDDSKAAWIRQLLRILPERYPAVTMLVWFNVDYGDPNWRIDSSAAATEAFRDGIAAPYFKDGPIN
jgi:mannan endo-1,4-beta-mannosidase